MGRWKSIFETQQAENNLEFLSSCAWETQHMKPVIPQVKVANIPQRKKAWKFKTRWWVNFVRCMWGHPHIHYLGAYPDPFRSYPQSHWQSFLFTVLRV